MLGEPISMGPLHMLPSRATTAHWQRSGRDKTQNLRDRMASGTGFFKEQDALKNRMPSD